MDRNHIASELLEAAKEMQSRIRKNSKFSLGDKVKVQGERGKEVTAKKYKGIKYYYDKKYDSWIVETEDGTEFNVSLDDSKLNGNRKHFDADEKDAKSYIDYYLKMRKRDRKGSSRTAKSYYVTEIEGTSMGRHAIEVLTEKHLEGTDYGYDGAKVYSDDKRALTNFVKEGNRRGGYLSDVERGSHAPFNGNNTVGRGKGPSRHKFSFDTPEEDEEFTKNIAKAFAKNKRELGIKGIKQNYKGTGRKKAHRQLWVRFHSGAVIDLWIEPERVTYGGVVWINAEGKRVRPNPTGFRINTDNVRRIADQITEDLKNWLDG
jgi:hypothetical protein